MFVFSFDLFNLFILNPAMSVCSLSPSRTHRSGVICRDVMIRGLLCGAAGGAECCCAASYTQTPSISQGSARYVEAKKMFLIFKHFS